MHRFINARSAKGIIVPNIERSRSQEERVRQQSIKKFTKRLKFTKQVLNDTSREELVELALSERIKRASSMSKPALIEALLRIEEPLVDVTGKTFSSEFVSKCVGNYKSAPWIKRLVAAGRLAGGIRVVGFALREGNEYATTFKIEPGWCRAKATWYTHVCNRGRKFEDYEVGYVIKSGNKLSVLRETREIYEASLENVVEVAPIGIGKAKISRKPTYRQESSTSSETEEILPGLQVEEVDYPSAPPKELAPGLFTHLRMLIKGVVIYCSACNTTMTTPPYKSVHGHQKVLFCSKACFDNYNFDEEPAVKSCKDFVFTIGDGDMGQLGSNREESLKFTKVRPSRNAIKVACGGMHTLYLTSYGQVYSFGCNDDGALGRPTDEEGENFRAGSVYIEEKIIEISAGDSFSVALTAAGNVYFWGVFRDSNGKVGDIVEPPVKLKTSGVKAIACGANHLLLLRNGDVYSIGVGEQGQLGRKLKGKASMKLRKIESTVKFDRIWAGEYSSFAREGQNGNIYAWGLNNYIQLGIDSDDLTVMAPTLTSFDPSKIWRSIVGGQHHTIALDDNGKVYALGRSEYGRLGLGKSVTQRCSKSNMHYNTSTMY